MDNDRGEDFGGSDPYGYEAEDAFYCVSGPLPGELDPEEALLYANLCAGVGA